MNVFCCSSSSFSPRMSYRIPPPLFFLSVHMYVCTHIIATKSSSSTKDIISLTSEAEDVTYKIRIVPID